MDPAEAVRRMAAKAQTDVVRAGENHFAPASGDRT
jgi:hypothetical protein